MPEALYTVRGLTKSYGAKEVLRGVDFEVERGECLVILGGSGSGKSVTLRQLNGLERPEGGSVVFDGVDLCTLSEKQLFPLRRRIGMLFQGGALFDSMNVAENVGYALSEHTGLDPRTAATIASLMRSTQERLGVTAVVVTHDLALARRVGDRLAFLHDGRFRFFGTWAEADDDDDPELAGFLAGREQEEEDAA